MKERREKEEREERKLKAKPKIKNLFTKSSKMKTYKINNLHQKLVSPPLFLLQNMRGIYRPPQGMKIPKTLITRLSYRTIG